MAILPLSPRAYPPFSLLELQQAFPLPHPKTYPDVGQYDLCQEDAPVV